MQPRGATEHGLDGGPRAEGKEKEGRGEKKKKKAKKDSSAGSLFTRAAPNGHFRYSQFPETSPEH